MKKIAVSALFKDRKIKPVLKTDKGYLYEIKGIKGLFKIKNEDKSSNRIIFEKIK